MEIGLEVSSEVLDWAGEVRALGTEAATEAGRYWIHLGLCGGGEEESGCGGQREGQRTQSSSSYPSTPYFLPLLPPLPRPALGTASLSLGLSDRPQVQCVRTYKALQPDELTLEKTDILAVRTWTSDGERGLLGRPS